MDQGIHYNGMPLKNPYQLLGISRNASDVEIKNAYRQLALKFHPDKQPPTLSESEREELDGRWHDINDAHHFLSDAENVEEKKKYDAHLAKVEASERVCQMASERVRQEEEERSVRQEEEGRSEQTDEHRNDQENRQSDEEEGNSRHGNEGTGQDSSVFSKESGSTSSINEDAGERTDESHHCSLKRSPTEELAHQITAKLASQAYHLPGNDWKQDLAQYLLNHHLLFGMFCHHPLHPLKLGQRMLLLLGSFSYGVTITNAISLYFLILGTSDEEEVFVVNLAMSLPGQQSNPHTFPVTMGILLLLTVGSGSHALFDHVVRNLHKGCYLLLFLALAVTIALSSCTLVVSASTGGWPSCDQCNEEVLELNEIFNNRSPLSFLTAYVLEFVTASLIYCPILETVLFSGIFGCCGRVPVIGGRPYEMRREPNNMQPDESSECSSQNEQSECPSQMA